MTAQEKGALDILLAMVQEIADSNREAHAEVLRRIECVKQHCSMREAYVTKQIDDAVARQRPFEIGAKTIGKFVAGMLVYTSLIVGIVTTVLKLA